MLEKVAAAILGELRLGTACEAEVRDCARAALEAMLEPSEGMVGAGTASITYGYPLPAEAVPDDDYAEDYRRGFRAMIQAALDGK